MIPDHLIDQAWRAYVRSSNQQAIRNELAYPDLRGPMPPPPDPRLSMRAALEAVAADIWDQGYRAGFSDGPIICACGARNDGECACGNYGNGETPEPNPYRASETA